MTTDSRKDHLLDYFRASSALPRNNNGNEAIISGLRTLFSGGVNTNPDPQSLTNRFRNSENPREPTSIHDYGELLLKDLIPHSINLTSPRCLGHMAGILPHFLHDFGGLVVSLNQNLVKREASRTFSLLERQTLAVMHRLIYGFTPSFYDTHSQNEVSTLGIMASGGTLANLTALWIARNSKLGPKGDFSGVEEEGLVAALDRYGYSGAVVIASSLAHYSIEKAVGMLGLGSRSLIKVPVDHHYRLELAALRNAIDRCHANGQLILAIVGLAGSTDCGSIDPLSDIADVAEESNTHFHVDAAWGGPLIFSDSYRSMLEGIERADSVTLDGHKQMYVPIGSSMLLLKSPQQANVIEKQAHYVLRQGSGDLGKRSVEGSRAGSALFLHAALSIIGSEGYGFLIEENIRKARFMAQLIRRSPEFELIAEPETNILLYRYLPRELRARSAKNGSLTDADNRRINDLNERLQKLQHEAGRTYVSRTTVEKCRCQQAVSLVALRAVIANPLTTEEDIKVVLQDQITIAATL